MAEAFSYPPGVDLKRVSENFALAGSFQSAVPHGTGHINDTYLVATEQAGRQTRAILQRINRRVFPRPVAIMENIQRVLEHVGKKMQSMEPQEASRRILRLIPARDGKSYWEDEAGEVWRAYRFIEGARGFDVAESPRQVYEAARTFGLFQQRLMDLPPPSLHETIPHFHDTPERFRALERALALDSQNRAAGARAEIEFSLARAPLAAALARLQERGALTARPVHNDTKLNNVLLDAKTGEGLCVIDLDTIMPGLGVWDFGDLVRSASNRAAEDERDLRQVEIDLALFESIARGWLEALASALPVAERAALLTGAQVITLECGVRFLTDYLEGDIYFKTHRPGHNLERCRVQLALLRSMEEKGEALARILRRCESQAPA